MKLQFMTASILIGMLAFIGCSRVSPNLNNDQLPAPTINANPNVQNYRDYWQNVKSDWICYSFPASDTIENGVFGRFIVHSNGETYLKLFRETDDIVWFEILPVDDVNEIFNEYRKFDYQKNNNPPLLRSGPPRDELSAQLNGERFCFRSFNSNPIPRSLKTKLENTLRMLMNRNHLKLDSEMSSIKEIRQQHKIVDEQN